MNSTTNIKNGRITIEMSLSDLLGSVAAEDRDDMLQQISCDDAVIRHVMDQVLTGYTANGSCGSSRMDEWDLGYGLPLPLDHARHAVHRFAEPVTQKYLEKLRGVLKHMKKRHDEYQTKAFYADRRKDEAESELRQEKAARQEERDRWTRCMEQMREELIQAQAKAVAP